jgi:hypothetical protein
MKYFIVLLFVTMPALAGVSQVFTIESKLPPTVKADAGDYKSIPLGDSVQLGGSQAGLDGFGNYVFLWSPATGLNNATLPNPWAKPGAKTVYTLMVTDLHHCTAMDEVKVNVRTSAPVQKRLSAGWTWFSLNVQGSDMSVDHVLSSVDAQDGDYIKNQTVSATYFDGTGWFGELTQINPAEMYKIKLANVDTLLFDGIIADPLTNPVPIKAGWNWIGHIPQSSRPVSQALLSIIPAADDYIKNQTQSSTFYEEAGWFGELTNLEPLDGYMLKTSHAATLTYPEDDPMKAEDGRRKTEDYKIVKPEAFEFSGQINAAVFLNGQNYESPDYCLYSVVDGQVRGVSRGMWFEPGKKWIHNHLTYSNFAEGDTVRFRLHDSSSGTWYRFEEYVVFKADMLVANALSPFILKNFSLLDPSALRPEPLLEIWPNPAKNQANLKFTLPTDQLVVIEVIDFTGRMVRELDLENRKAGDYLEPWNTETLEPGLYHVRIRGTKASKQLVIIK